VAVPWLAWRLGPGAGGAAALLVATATALPLSTWLLRARFARVGESVELAARMEGLGSGLLLRSRVLPQAQGARSTAFTAAFAAAWASGWIPAASGLATGFLHAAPSADPDLRGVWTLLATAPGLLAGLALVRPATAALATPAAPVRCGVAARA
jgi:hypothetical protein